MKAIARIMLVVVLLVTLVAGNAIADSRSDAAAAAAASAAASSASSSSSSSNSNSSVNGSGNGTAVINEKLQLPGTPGFGSFAGSGVTIDGTQWDVFCPKIYRKLSFTNQVNEMAFGFHFSDLWFRNWGGRVQFTSMGPSLPASDNDMMMCTNYWPLDDANDGDVVVGRGEVVGKEDWSLEAFVGEAYKSCREEKNSNRVAILVSQDKRSVTYSQSLQVSASMLTAGGNSGGGGATGFGFGESDTRYAKIDKIKYACLNDGSADLIRIKITREPEPEPAQPKPEKPKCDIEATWAEIRRLWIEIDDCKKLSENNLEKREEIMRKYIRLYVCTDNQAYLDKVIFHFEWAQANYDGGWDIAAHQSKADKIIGTAQYNAGGAIFIRGGNYQKHMTKYKLEKIPKGFVKK